MSRRLIFTSLFTLLTSLFAVAQNAQLRWDTQLDRPVDHNIIIYRGETLALLPRIVQGTDPVTITNAAINFNYREPALISSNLYRQVACITNAAPGTLQMIWTPALDVGSTTYDYNFTIGDNPRVHGRITMRGTLTYPASTIAPLPASYYITDLQLTAATNALGQSFAADLQSTSNALAQAVHDTHAFAATNLTTRLSQPDGTSWTDIINGTQMLHTVITTTNAASGYVIAEIYYNTNPGAYTPYTYMATGDYFIFHSTTTSSYWAPNATNNWFFHNGNTNALALRHENIRAAGYFTGWKIADGPNGEWFSSQDEDADELELDTGEGLGAGEFDSWVRLVSTNSINISISTNTQPVVTQSVLDTAINAIPTFPTNYTAGIILPDVGTNLTYTLIITNGLLSLWEILP